MLNELNATLAIFIAQTQMKAHALLWIVLILYGSYLLTRIFPFLYALGIWPRHVYGLPGIFFAPFLHADFNHLFFNTIPLIILSNFVLFNGTHYFIVVSFYIALISGFLTWCFAKDGIHLGSSGVVTGYWGLLVSNIYQQETFISVILGLVCIYYFSGIFFGVFPGKKGISWEGHLFGLLAGISASYLTILFAS